MVSASGRLGPELSMTPSTPPRPVPSVILRHDTPDGGWHFDWMILLENARLLTFRVDERPDQASTAFEAIRLADHRAAYLDFEGELTDGRGRVTRVARGEVAIIERTTERVVIEGGYDGPNMRWGGVLVEGDRWRFERREACGG